MSVWSPRFRPSSFAGLVLVVAMVAWLRVYQGRATLRRGRRRADEPLTLNIPHRRFDQTARNSTRHRVSVSGADGAATRRSVDDDSN